MNPKSFVKFLAEVKRVILLKTNPRQKLLERLPKSAVCAEIGVWKGDFTSKILEIASPQRLHLIDPWEFQCEFPERMYGGKVAKKQEDMNQIYQSVRQKFQQNRNVTIHRGFSENVLQEFEDDYFDWVYIDGNHYYEYVLKDLQLSLLKVKPGGLIAGDDYTWSAKDGFPVKRAVKDFIKENNLEQNLEVFGSQFVIKL